MTDYFDLYKEKKDECLECPFFDSAYDKDEQKIIYECKGQYLKTNIYGHLKENCMIFNIEDVLKEFIQFLKDENYIKTKKDAMFIINEFMR